jgi:hypothetical protein
MSNTGDMGKSLFTNLVSGVSKLSGKQDDSDSSLSSAVRRLRDVLRKLGMNDESIGLFLLFIQPIASKYVEIALSEAFSDAELLALTDIAVEKGFDLDQRNELIYLAYEKNTGKKIEDEADDYYDQLATALEDGKAQIVKLFEETKDLPEEEKEKRIKEFTDKIDQDNIF